MRRNLSLWLLAFTALCAAGVASAQIRLEQRVSVLPSSDKIGETMVVDGDWAALGTTRSPGKVQMCRRLAGVWTVVQTLTSPVGGGGNFGFTLALNGEWLAVYEYHETWSGGQTLIRGVLRLYHRQGDSWVLTQSLRPAPEDIGEGDFGFGNSVTIKDGRLAVTADQYFAPGESGMDHERMRTTLLVYRLQGALWQVEQVLPVPGLRVGYGAPSLSLQGDWLAMGDPGVLSKDYHAAGAVMLFQRKSGQWKQAQTLRPPADGPSLLLGQHAGFADADHLLMSTTTGVLESRWEGGKWTAPESIGTAAGKAPHILRVAGPVAAVHTERTVRLLRRDEDGWKLMRILPEEASYASMALSADTVLFLSDFVPGTYQWQSVSFVPVADLEVRLVRARVGELNSRQVSQPPEIAPGSELGWQSHLEGDEMAFTVTNTTPGLLPRPDVSLTGDQAGSFEILPQVQITALMVPGEVAPYALRVREGVQVTDARVTVTVRTGGVLPDYSFTVRWQRTGDVLSLPQVSLIPGAFWELGQPVQMAPKISGVSPKGQVTYHWRRDDVEIAGQDHAVLVIPEVRPEHAGLYELEIRHRGGSTRPPRCRVAVFEMLDRQTTLRDGESARLETRFWGPVSVVWLSPDNYYQELISPYLAGITLPTLTIVDGRWIDPGGVNHLEALATLVDPVSQMGITSAFIARHQLVSTGRRPIVIPAHSRLFNVGESVSETGAIFENARTWYGARGGWPGSVASVSGLPPGIKLNADGTIEGTFEKEGVYTLTWQVRDASGMVSDPVQSEMIVGLPGPAADAGQYVGWVTGPEEIPGMNFGGTVEVRLGTSGSFSGVLRLPGATRRFAGMLRGLTEDAGAFKAEVAVAALPGTRSTIVRLYALPGQQIIPVEIPCVLKPGEREEVLTTTMQGRPRLPAPPADGRVGSYNVLLDLSEASHERQGPGGTGIFRVTATRNFLAHAVGTLADGTGFTCGGQLIPEDTGLKLLVFQEGTGAERFLLGGSVRIGTPGRPLFLEGSLRWRKPPAAAAKLYPAGFDVNLHAEGWRYLLPPPGALLLSESPNRPGNAVCQTDLLDDGLLRLTSTHRAIPHGGGTPNSLLRLDVYPPTGFFTGQVGTAGQTLESGARVPARKAPFRGLILPPTVGGGFYHWVEPGETRPTSRYLRLYPN